MMKGTHQNYGFSSDFSSEFPQHLPQIYDSQLQSSPVGLFNPPPPPSSSSSSRENGSQQQKIWPSNSSSTMISSIVSPSSAFYATEVYTNLPQYNFQENIGLSESEQLLYLKNKLLGDLDDENQNLAVSENLYASHFENINQFGGQPSNNCGSVSSSKTRIRWTQDLHDRFVECVNRLGGPEKATPKAILKLMCAEGLTILQVKSHLQKYRQVKYVPESVEGRSEKKNSTHNVAQFDIENGMQIKEALQLQLDVQRRLHEQLEIQKKLQLRIEQEAKRLKVMIDQQQKTTRNLTHSSSKGPDTHEEDSEVFVSEGSDDDDIVLSST